jgi:hypothetical protein
MRLTNKSNLPEAIVNAVANDPYSSKGSDISTTVLIAPPRIRVLRNQHDNEIEEDVADKIFALIGSSVHYMIERAKTRKDLAEKRLFYKGKETNGWMLSGRFDLLSKGTLIDFKVTSAWSVVDAMAKGKPEWEQQLNVLDFLCRHNPDELTIYQKKIQPKSLAVMGIMRDWSIRQVQKSDNYPKQQVMMIPVRKWSEQEQSDFITARIKTHQNAETGTLPLCTAKERWATDNKYAIYKDGRKNALRLLDTKEQVKQYLNDNNLIDGKRCKVVLRKGEDVRCQSYCPVNQFCDYYLGGVKF